MTYCGVASFTSPSLSWSVTPPLLTASLLLVIVAVAFGS